MIGFVAPVALFFAGMGVYALMFPARICAFFGMSNLTIDGRSEVRAVYGGFGIAIAIVLFASIANPDWAGGVLLTVSVALLGMAGGRLVSRIIDGQAGTYPWLFFGVEVFLATMLMAALLTDAPW